MSVNLICGSEKEPEDGKGCLCFVRCRGRCEAATAAGRKREEVSMDNGSGAEPMSRDLSNNKASVLRLLD